MKITIQEEEPKSSLHKYAKQIAILCSKTDTGTHLQQQHEVRMDGLLNSVDPMHICNGCLGSRTNTGAHLQERHEVRMDGLPNSVDPVHICYSSVGEQFQVKYSGIIPPTSCEALRVRTIVQQPASD